MLPSTHEGAGTPLQFAPAGHPPPLTGPSGPALGALYPPPCVFGTYGGNLGRPGPPRPARRAWRLGPTRGGGSLGRGPEGEALFHLRIYWAAGGFPGRGWARAARGARAGSIALARSLSLFIALARGAVRQSVGERGGGEGRGEGRPLPYKAQAPPPDVTL